MKTTMIKAVAAILCMALLLSLCACTGGNVPADQPGEQPARQPDAPQSVHADGEYCTEDDILAVRNEANKIEGLPEAAMYLVFHQDEIPEAERECIEKILAGSDFALLDGKEQTDSIDMRYPDVIMGVLFIHGTDIGSIMGTDEPLPADVPVLADGDNSAYLVDATAYPKPEDGADFLPYFKTFKPEVLDEALGVTLTSPREITDTTTCVYGSVARAALITNTSDKTMQLIPANDLTEADWQKVEGYDPTLIVAWNREPGTEIIPLGHANVLAPGESTVVRYTYIGREGQDFTFQSRFSMYVTDGKTTELLAATVLNHVMPSKYNPGSCTISGTVCDEQTGLPLQGIGVQSSRNENDFAVTDKNGRFTLTAPAIRFDSTGNWARASIFVNEIGLGSNHVDTNPSYAEECVIVEPKDGGSMELALALKKKPAQVNYTVQTEHDLGIQAYGFDTAADIIATAPFHTTFSEEYKYENGRLHVFDKTGALLFEKPLYGEVRTCDVSTDGKLIATIVHGKNEGEPDTAVVWDITGKEVFSYQIPYVDNDALYVKPDAPSAGVFSNLHDAEISNDNTMLAIQTDEGYVCVVRMTNGANICGFYMKSGNNHKLLFSADDKVIYTASECGDLRATEIRSGNVLWEKYIESMIMDYVLTDTSVITSSKATGVSYLICTELATGKTLWTLDVGMRCAKMSLSRDQKTLFWGTDTTTTNERALLIDTATGTPLWAWISGKQAAAFSADDRYVMTRSGGSLTLRTITGEHLYGALIAPDDNSMSWGLYMSGDCKYVVSFAGGRTDERFYGMMYALTLDENTPLE